MKLIFSMIWFGYSLILFSLWISLLKKQLFSFVMCTSTYYFILFNNITPKYMNKNQRKKQRTLLSPTIELSVIPRNQSAILTIPITLRATRWLHRSFTIFENWCNVWRIESIRFFAMYLLLGKNIWKTTNYWL